MTPRRRGAGDRRRSRDGGLGRGVAGQPVVMPVAHRAGDLPPMLLLDHLGAKSGKRRTAPLIYVRDGDNVAVIASKGGNPRHPAWFHNLRAHPDTTIQIGSRRLSV